MKGASNFAVYLRKTRFEASRNAGRLNVAILLEKRLRVCSEIHSMRSIRGIMAVVKKVVGIQQTNPGAIGSDGLVIEGFSAQNPEAPLVINLDFMT